MLHGVQTCNYGTCRFGVYYFAVAKHLNPVLRNILNCMIGSTSNGTFTWWWIECVSDWIVSDFLTSWDIVGCDVILVESGAFYLVAVLHDVKEFDKSLKTLIICVMMVTDELLSFVWHGCWNVKIGDAGVGELALRLLKAVRYFFIGQLSDLF